MKKQIIFILCSSISVFSSQSIRYKEKVFNEVKVTSDIQYGSNVDYEDNITDLFLDLYEPKNDTNVKRPCIVLVHGGVFLIGDKLEPTIVALCENFALRGYVTASIQYRLGTGLNFKGFAEAILRAVQDAKAAVRFLRKNKDTYGIDEAKFVVGGTSAGGVTALHYAYMDSHEIPSEVDTTVLGGIEGESGTPGISSTIACIVNCWGAIGDTAFIQKDEQIPVISFHGTEDAVVPYDVGFALNLPILPLCGSAAVERQCNRLGITSKLRLYTGMGHGHGVDTLFDTTEALMSEFLYKNLIDNSLIFTLGSTKEKNSKSMINKFLYTRGAASNIHFTNLRDLGIIYSINGRRLGNLKLNTFRTPSGFYVFRND